MTTIKDAFKKVEALNLSIEDYLAVTDIITEWGIIKASEATDNAINIFTNK